MRKIMASLDIGNCSVKLVVGEMVKNKLNILAVSDVPTKGVSKSKIVNKEQLEESLKSIFKDSSDRLGFDIKKCIVCVPSCSAEFSIGEASIDIENDDKVIRSSDIVKVLQKSCYGVVQDNMELVSIMPTVFKLDDNTVVVNPKNRISSVLAVKSVIVTSYKKDVYPVLECLEDIGIEVVDITYDSLGDYNCFRNKNEDKEIGAIVNIGDVKTTISIFNKGVLTNTALLDLGGINIDNDIAFIYKVLKSDARDLKINFSLASSKFASSSEVMAVKNKVGENIKINQSEISDVVNSRLDEILNMVKRQINVLTKKQISYIIVTGGVTEMSDFALVLEKVFGKNVTLGRINELGVRNNKFSSAVGLIKWYNNNQLLKGKDYSILDLDEQEEFSGVHEQTKISDNSIIGKVFGYFFE